MLFDYNKGLSACQGIFAKFLIYPVQGSFFSHFLTHSLCLSLLILLFYQLDTGTRRFFWAVFCAPPANGTALPGKRSVKTTLCRNRVLSGRRSAGMILHQCGALLGRRSIRAALCWDGALHIFSSGRPGRLRGREIFSLWRRFFWKIRLSCLSCRSAFIAFIVHRDKSDDPDPSMIPIRPGRPASAY